MIPSIGNEPSSSSSSSEDEDSDDEYREEEGAIENKESEEEGEVENELSDVEKTGKTKEGKHECPYCEKKFRFPNKLREHVIVHKSNRFECNECNSKFDTMNQLRTHQKLRHSQASHKCPQCSYTSRLADVRRHFIQNHVDGVPCTVVGCGIKIAKNRLKAHLKEVHGPAVNTPPPRPIRAKLSFNTCPKCDYKPDESIFDAEEQHKDLMRHIELVHEKKGRSICPFGCGATIIAEENQNHWTKCTKFSSDEPSTSTPRLVEESCHDTNTVTSQSVSSEYPGDTDSETFPTSSQGISASLNEIELDEKNEKTIREPPQKKRKSGSRRRGEFNCHLCEKTFTMIDNLRKHIRSFHSENSKKEVKKYVRKPNQFKCDRKSTNEETCGKTFRTEQALQDHFNVHDDLKPYKCLTCNQGFHARDRFAVHLSKYHLTSIKDLTANDTQFREKNEIPGKSTPPTS
ncbi:unnamed protein product [Caenorhabditis brenneri]